MKKDKINNIRNSWLEHSDTQNKKELFRISNVYVNKHSERQLIQVLELAECGKTFLLDGHFQITDFSCNPYHEFLATISCTFLKRNPNKILICGGGDGVTLSKLYKIQPSSFVDLVEYDQEVIETSKKYLYDWNDSIFEKSYGEIIIGDALTFIDGCDNKTYDSIICDITPPHSGCNPKFWTKDFLNKLIEKLKGEGNIVMLGDNIDIKSTINSEFMKIAKELFQTTMPIINPFTGTSLFFLCDRKIDINGFIEEVLYSCPDSFENISIDSLNAAIYLGKILIK